MFDTGVFDRILFGRAAQDDGSIELVLELWAQMRQMVGSGENIHDELYIQEAAEGRMMAAAGTACRLAFDARMAQEAAVRPSLCLTLSAKLVFDGWARGVWMSHLTLDFAGEMGSYAYFGRELWLGGYGGMAAAWGAAMRLGGDGTIGPAWWDAWMDAVVSRRRLRTVEALFDVDLGPGQELVVDSDDYTVLLEGRNAIDKHSGGWLVMSGQVLDVRFEVQRGRASDLRVMGDFREKWL